MRRKTRRIKGSNTIRSAKATAMAARQEQYWPQRANGRSGRNRPQHKLQHWPQLQEAALATARRLHQRPQHWPQRAGHTRGRSTVHIEQATLVAAVLATERWPAQGLSTGSSALFTTQAAALAAARIPKHRPLHWPQNADYTNAAGLGSARWLRHWPQHRTQH